LATRFYGIRLNRRSTFNYGWDILTYIGSCDIQKNCGEGRDMKFDSEMEAEFNRELDGTKQTKDAPAK
jgi:hypothetical protein